MQVDLSIEIRKLEVRLKEYLEAKKEADKLLERYIGKLKELNNFVQSLPSEKKSNLIRKMLELRYEVVKAFQEALKSESKAEHEKSHILESHGQIILALEEQIQKIIS